MRILILISLIGVSCSTPPKADESIKRIPANQVLVDEEFIENSVGKPFIYVHPQKTDGEPNCVAAALRAGGYLPAFVVNGTDAMYDNILPLCFRRKTEAEPPAKGDLGVIYAERAPTLAHMVLFLDNDRVFEKPGPQNDQVFRYNSWKQNRASVSDFEGYSLQVWTYDPATSCPLNEISRDFNKPESNNLRVAAKEIEQRIFLGNWDAKKAFSKNNWTT